MDLIKFRNDLKLKAKENAPALLSLAAGTGTVLTVYLAAKAGYETAKKLDEVEEIEGVADDKWERLRDRTRYVWRLYIPTAVSAGGTIVCIAGAHRAGFHKTMAAQTALSASQQLFAEYRERVIRDIGEHKDQAIRDQVAEDRVASRPPPSNEVLIIGDGKVLCHESFTQRYFECDMQTLKKAQNDVNAKLFMHDYVTMTDFYWMVGLRQTDVSSSLGWTMEKGMMDLQVTTVLTEDDRPCLSFTYNYTTPL